MKRDLLNQWHQFNFGPTSANYIYDVFPFYWYYINNSIIVLKSTKTKKRYRETNSVWQTKSENMMKKKTKEIIFAQKNFIVYYIFNGILQLQWDFRSFYY